MSYYNPNYLYPQSYPAVYPNMQQSFQQSYNQPQQQGFKYMEWVDGEIGARAFQMPANLQPNQPIPLWDSTDTNIFLKSWSPTGVPNPIQKLHYEMPDQQQYLPAQQNVSTQSAQNYATKEDLEGMKHDLEEMIHSLNMRNNNGNNINNNNRKGNPTNA